MRLKQSLILTVQKQDPKPGCGQGHPLEAQEGRSCLFQRLPRPGLGLHRLLFSKDTQQCV